MSSGDGAGGLFVDMRIYAEGYGCQKWTGRVRVQYDDRSEAFDSGLLGPHAVST
jgi:hypothetical protein